MLNLIIDGEECEFKSWKRVHDDLFYGVCDWSENHCGSSDLCNGENCNCHYECATSSLNDLHDWEEIEEEGPDAHDIATGDPQMTPDDITAHSEGLDCEMEDCERCETIRSEA